MLKVDRQALLEALLVANCAVEKRPNVPVLSHIRLTTEKNRGSVTGTDLQTAVICPFEGNCARKVDVLLPARRLLDILKNVQSNEKDINIDLKDGRANVNHAEINTLPAAEYPVLPEIKKPVKMELRGFESVIKRAVVAAGEHDARYVLNSILLDFKNKAVVATDGHRLHRVGYRFTIDHPQVLIPVSTAKLLKGDTIRARIDSKCGIFDNGRYTLFCKFIEGTYPEWKVVIPKESTVRIMADRIELIELAQESLPMVRERANAGKLTVTKNRLCIESVDPGLGLNKSAIKAECHGTEELAFGINLGYLLDTLRQLKKDNVTLQMTDPLSPIKIVEEDFLALLMPMRI
jgi:DNA polymerase-3 subunit beta